MTIDRRALLSRGLVAGAAISSATVAAVAGPRNAARLQLDPALPGLAITPSLDNQSARLQAAIEATSAQGAALVLPAGTFRAAGVTLRPGTRIVGSGRSTVLEFSGGETFLSAENAAGISIENLTIDGANLGLDAASTTGLIHLRDCQNIVLRDIHIRRSLLNGLSLERCSGRVSDCSISDVAQTGLFSLDAIGLELLHNRISHCDNNGIQV